MSEVDSAEERLSGLALSGVAYPVGTFALTPLQSGMLFHQIQGGEAERGVDLEQLVCRTSEKIDFEAFARAVGALVKGYPILRTQFAWKSGGEPTQEVIAGVEPSVALFEREEVSEGEREQDFLRCLAEDRAEGMALGAAPLLRARLFRYGPEDTRLLFTLHHAIVDGRCFPILLEDFFALYEAEVAGNPSPGVRGSMDFREFAGWINAQPFAEQSQTYWSELLQGFTAPTPLTVEGLPDGPSEDPSWQEEIHISPEETRALEALAERAEVTMNTVVQAAWSVLLGKYSGEEEVVFGGTRACRKSSLPAVENAVGLFINTLPVRAGVEADKPLLQLLQELRAQWVAMRAHEHTPLGQIQTWSDLEKGQTLFQSIVVFEKFDLGERMKAQGGAWEERQIVLYEKTNFPLTVAAYHSERLRIKIEFAREKFSVATIRRMLGHLGELLRQFASESTPTLRDLHLITKPEMEALCQEWATPQKFPVPGTLVAWFERQVEKAPDAIALSYEGREWTYGLLNRAANKVAHGLLTCHGVHRGQIVGLCVARSPEVVIGILGILKAGAAYLPIDLAYPGARLQWILEDSKAPVLLTQEALLEKLPEIEAKTVTFELLEKHDASEENPNVESNPEDLAYVIFTSGSTGKPKGCQITHANVARLLTATEPWFHFCEDDVWTLFHSFAFDFSVWEIWGPLLYGGRLVVVPYETTRSPEDFYQLLRKEGVTVLNQTPSAFRQLAEIDRQFGGASSGLRLREVIFGGEALELESLRSWFERHGDHSPRLVNMYGITETTVHVTYRPLSKNDLSSGSVIGRPIPDLELYLLDAWGHPVPLGVPGEIHVGGAGVAAGYLNRPELTAQRFLPHPRRSGEKLYRTGDVARFLPGGDLEYLGRCDDQVKIRGFRIELGEIQSVLTRHAAVREAFVTVVGEGQDKKIVAYLVGDREAADLTALRAHAGASLPPYMIPAAIVFLEKFPLTNNGKIDRQALPAPEDGMRALSRNSSQAPAVTRVQRKIAAIWQKVLGVSEIGIDDNFFELGGHSILLIQVHALLRVELQEDLSVVDLLGNSTIRKLAGVIGKAPEVRAAAPVRKASAPRTKDIAIVGMSGRFPGAETVTAFWENLVANVESILAHDDEALRKQGLDPDAMRAAGDYVARRGQIPDPDCFDAEFFNMSPREAAVTDPQQRLFLETAWSALEDAGYAPSRYRERIGVFAGMSNNSFYEQYVEPDTLLREQLGDLLVMMGNEKDYLATRTAYKLNLSGPALNVYTACSTSLVALAEAVFALREGRCEMAVAGAISLTFPQSRGYFYEEGGITSPDGHCRPFDEQAGGTVFSNGMGAVVLKPLEEALAAGDAIHAVVRGVGLNNDGSDKVSFMAPSVEGQARAIREAYEQAGVEPDTIGYVEGHGTGTSLGDPVEVEALTRAFRQGTDQKQFCVLGSVKSNLGHLDAAAGIAGLIKATLALREELIPGTLHVGRANPKLRLEESPFKLSAENRSWERTAEAPRRAGVSSFGVGGTNAHLLLEEAPLRPDSGASPRTKELLLLSARSNEALARKRQELVGFLEENREIPLADIAFTLAVGREVFAHRLTITASTRSEAIAALRDEGIKSTEARHVGLPVSFLFPGQGAQYVGMGLALYDGEPVFRAEIDACAVFLEPLLGRDLREIIFGRCDDAEALLKKTRFTQPALFVMSCALSALWKAHGVCPASMIGHSVGEYSAAYLSGVLSREDALRLIATRAALVDEQDAGAMLSIRLPEDEVRPLLTPGVEMAALNSPKMTVVAGTFEALEVLEKKLAAADIAHKRLRTSHAFHSAMMDPVVVPFRDAVAQVSFSEPQIPFVSNVTGAWITPEDVARPDYWAAHVRQAVRFTEGVRCLTEEHAALLLEVGPGRSCVTFARQSLDSTSDHPVLATLPKESGVNDFLDSVGKLWAAGGEIDWEVYYGEEGRRRVSLPAYPFERKRHWPQGCRLNLPLQAREVSPAVAVPVSLAAPVVETPAAETPAPAPQISRLENLVRELSGQIQDLTGLEAGELAPEACFLDLGLDSLLIGQAAVRLSRHFGTKVTFRHLMDEHDSIQSLARYLEEALPAEKFAPQATPAPTPVPVAPLTEVSGDDVGSRLARIEQTLVQLVPGAMPVASSSSEKARYEAGGLHQDSAAPVTFGPFRAVEEAEGQTLTARQKQHLSHLIRDYASFTEGSKALVQDHRAQLADPRAVAGFNPLWKEMVYPVVVERSEGAQLWDVDGNRWIDVTHGFGVGFFGHRPRFVVDAVAKQLEIGFEIGPSSPLAGEVAAMICEVSGKDRTTFCNTGSEAVTAAIRIARTVSMRDKIAVFQGSYHGIFDEVLGRPLVKNGELVTAPIAPGLPTEHLENVLILDYNDPESLKFIERYADDLAAVLVEPVQSRRPDLQPREFLHQLRALTAKHDIALVFDEVVTGFRVHPRGAQGVFEIDADLVTYGKVLGGGMPIGALAGRKKYMDALDGGAWQYGDDSGPEAAVTFFAGTFVRHPLALVAARAVLQELAQGDGRLQEGLDARTATMVATLNAYCVEIGVPVKLTHFSSIYYINIAPSLKYASLFFFHMRLRGIHIWETRPSFLSLAHSEEDIEGIMQAFRESIVALQKGGFFPGGEQEDTFALTPEQEELFLASQMDPAQSRAFNESISILFEGALDSAALTAALRKLVARHPSLRTIFEEDGSGQRVVPQEKFSFVWEEVDLREADEELADYREQFSSAPFDLLQGPLARFALFRTGEESHELVLSIHHSVCDGWSFGVLYEDLIALYRVELGQLENAGPSTPFRTYVESRSTPEALAAAKEDTAFWAEALSPLPPSLSLPIDRVGGEPSLASASLNRELSPALCERIGAYCKEQRITPYVLLFSAYREILTRLSGQEDFCIGTPVAGQGNSGLPGLCGHGMHFLPVRCRLSEATTVSECLAENRGMILESLDHQQSTLSQILEAMSDGPRMEPVTATFTLEGFSPEFDLSGTKASLQVNPKSASTFDLSLFAVEREGQFSLMTSFAASKFSAERVGNWLDLLTAWLETVVSSPVETPLASLTLAPESPFVFALPPTRDIVSVFEEQVERTPQNVALRCEQIALTYEQVNGFANQIALRLQSVGVKPGDRVALVVDRSLELIVTLLATLKCGAAYVPIDPNYPEERIALLREESAPSLVIDQDLMAALVRDLDTVKTFPNLEISPEPNDLAYVMFTSGSTGRPKGVMVPHRGVTRLVVDPSYVELNEEDVFLLAAPVSFDASTFEIWGPLLNGGALAIPPKGALTLDEIADCLQRYEVTVLWLTSGLFQLMMEENPKALTRLRVLMAGGDVLSRAHVEQALTLLPYTQVLNGYGPTENTTFTTCHAIITEDVQRPTIPIGKAISGTTVSLLDGAGQAVAPGLEGELYTGGNGVALGYLNRPEQTAEVFVKDPSSEVPGALLYRTGDRCRVLPGGALEFLGRVDQQIKLRGYRVEPGEIEHAIEAHASISRCRVLVMGEGADDKELVACCVGEAQEKDALVKSLRTVLPGPLLPARVLYFEELPLSPNGKVDGTTLRKQVDERGVPEEKKSALVPPETPTEKRLHAMWGELLGNGNFGIHDAFFEIGGHSLLGLRMFHRLQKEMAFVRPLAVLFEHPTIASLARLIDSAREAGTERRVATGVPQYLGKIREGGSGTGLFLVHGGDGGTFFYRDLAAKLTSLDCPIYAIESQSVTDAALQVPPLERMLSDYLAMVRSAQPAGPYHIGGYSFGGVVAYELARRLEQAGEEVKLVLFDTANPITAESGRLSLPGRLGAGWRMHGDRSVMQRMGKLGTRLVSGAKSKRQHLNRLARCELLWREGRLDDLDDRLFFLNELHARLIQDFIPQGRVSNALLVRSIAPNDLAVLPWDYGWTEELVANLTIAEVPVAHLDLFEPESIEAMHEAVIEFLE